MKVSGREGYGLTPGVGAPSLRSQTLMSPLGAGLSVGEYMALPGCQAPGLLLLPSGAAGSPSPAGLVPAICRRITRLPGPPFPLTPPGVT